MVGHLIVFQSLEDCLERNIGYICFQSVSTDGPPDKIIWGLLKMHIQGPKPQASDSVREIQDSAFLVRSPISYFTMKSQNHWKRDHSQ